MSRSRARRAPAPRPGAPARQTPAHADTPLPGPGWPLAAAIAAGLVLLDVFVYWQVHRFGFVSIDDPLYVKDNAMVTAGLTRAGVWWALTSGYASNWHPITWLSHMLDVQLFGVAPGAHHLVNLAFHAVNTLLLFVWLRRATGATWPSAFVAALFGVHPLHVESVAWIAERKDMLSTCLWLLTMGGYLAYVRRPGWARGALVVALYALGLMAKPMLVTLPIVLAVLHWWPIGDHTRARPSRPRWTLLAIMGVLAIASSIATLIAQRHGGAVVALEALPFSMRAANAIVAAATYLGKMVWPVSLAVFYPLAAPPAGEMAFAVVVLGGISIVAWLGRRRAPYLLAGWLWYVITLVPVIGLVQVGMQSMADRYTYVPLIGIFVMIAWGVPDLVQRLARSATSTALLAVPAAIAVAALALTARVQASYWSDSITLWTHALDATPNNYRADDSLGSLLADENRWAEALPHFERVVALNANYGFGQYNLGVGLMHANRPAEALDHLAAAARLMPDDFKARREYGHALVQTGHVADAIPEFQAALRADPRSADAHADLGFAYQSVNRLDDAVAEYSAALRLDPARPETLQLRGFVRGVQGHFADAETDFEAAIRLKPDFTDAHESLAMAFAASGRSADARREYEAVLRLDPGNVQARKALGR